MERVSSSSQLQNGQTYYIPHHHVRKESSTTPICIVYDCSCQMSDNYPSLNDCLEIGPPLINDLCSILIRFCVHKYGVVTDIEKAFLHLKLHNDDQDFTRFLWLSNPQDPESEFEVYYFIQSSTVWISQFTFHVKCHTTSPSQKLKFRHS